MPIITPDGELLNPRIIYSGHSNFGELGEVFMFRVHEDEDDEYGMVFLVAFVMGSPGWSWYIGTVNSGLQSLHNQHNYHKMIYDECDPYDIYEKLGTLTSGQPDYDFEEIKYPEKAGKVIDYCLAEGLIKLKDDGTGHIHIQPYVDYAAQNKDYINRV